MLCIRTSEYTVVSKYLGTSIQMYSFSVELDVSFIYQTDTDTLDKR